MPRPVVTFGAEGIVLDELTEKVMTQLNRQELDFHRHVKGQFVLSRRGVLTCEVAGGLWLVPPQSAIWIPGGVLHKIEAAGTIECYVTYIDPAVATHLPPNCCALSTTPLLRELLIRSASMPMLYEEGSLESHLVTLLLDEIAVAPVGTLHLPMPAEVRLRKTFAGLMADPADRATAQIWARPRALPVGAARRTPLIATGRNARVDRVRTPSCGRARPLRAYSRGHAEPVTCRISVGLRAERPAARAVREYSAPSGHGTGRAGA